MPILPVVVATLKDLPVPVAEATPKDEAAVQVLLSEAPDQIPVVSSPTESVTMRPTDHCSQPTPPDERSL